MALSDCCGAEIYEDTDICSDCMEHCGEDEPTTEEIDCFLDELRDSGVTNMFGAAAYLIDEFGFDRTKAKDELLRWMKVKEDEDESN